MVNDTQSNFLFIISEIYSINFKIVDFITYKLYVKIILKLISV